MDSYGDDNLLLYKCDRTPECFTEWEPFIPQDPCTKVGYSTQVLKPIIHSCAENVNVAIREI